MLYFTAVCCGGGYQGEGRLVSGADCQGGLAGLQDGAWTHLKPGCQTVVPSKQFDPSSQWRCGSFEEHLLHGAQLPMMYDPALHTLLSACHHPS